MTQAQDRAIALANARRKQAQTEAPSFGERLIENVIGRGEVDTPGERLGATIGDVAKSFGSGITTGVGGLLSLPSLIDRGLTQVQTAGLRAILPDAPEESIQRAGQVQTPFSGGVPVAQAIEVPFDPQTTAGEFAQTAGEFVPGAALFGGLSPANLARFGVGAGVASEAAGQLTEGTSAEPFARAAGAIAGPLAAGGLARLGARAITPNPADAGRLSLAKVLDDFGVPISAGQRVGSESLRRSEGLTGAGRRLAGDQAEAFTAAALKTTGETAKRATPEVLNSAFKRVGGVFDDVSKGIDIPIDGNMLTRFSNSINTYRSLTAKGQIVPILGEVNRKAVQAFRSGNPFSSAQYQSFRTTLSKMTTSSVAAEREAAKEMLSGLDDAMEGALIAAGRPADIARLATARVQYRNLLAVERAATGAGEKAATGIISPSALRNAVVTQGRSSFARGTRGELGDLARAGEAIIKPLPTSGTAENLRALGVPAGVGAIAGAELGAQFGSPAAGALIGGLAAPALNALKSTSAGQRFLANQLITAQPRAFGPGLLGPIVSGVE